MRSTLGDGHDIEATLKNREYKVLESFIHTFVYRDGVKCGRSLILFVSLSKSELHSGRGSVYI